MPPIDYKDYPKNWKTEIVPAVLKRAGEVRDENGKITIEACCEKCGVQNHRIIVRNPDNGEYYYYTSKENAERQNHKWTKVCLTTAHLYNDKSNDKIRLDRLRSWCQRCHLLYDLKHHIEKARISREKKKKQQKLF